jgi:hypothetical protein
MELLTALAIMQHGSRSWATRRGGACLALAVVLTAVPLAAQTMAGSQSPPEEPPEYAVKAAFLLNFARFVEWPREAFSGPDSSLTICILGDDPFGQTLDRIVEGEQVQNLAVAVRRVRDIPRSGSCQVIYLSDAAVRDRELMGGIRPGVLTVSSSESSLENGGMIEFAIEDRRVRFDINERAASAAGLRLSSQLLRVARSVR